MSTSLREAVAYQIAGLAEKIKVWEAAKRADLAEGIALMRAQMVHAHAALQADDVLALLAIKEELDRDHGPKLGQRK